MVVRHPTIDRCPGLMLVYQRYGQSLTRDFVADCPHIQVIFSFCPPKFVPQIEVGERSFPVVSLIGRQRLLCPLVSTQQTVYSELNSGLFRRRGTLTDGYRSAGGLIQES